MTITYTDSAEEILLPKHKEYIESLLDIARKTVVSNRLNVTQIEIADEGEVYPSVVFGTIKIEVRFLIAMWAFSWVFFSLFYRGWKFSSKKPKASHGERKLLKYIIKMKQMEKTDMSLSDKTFFPMPPAISHNRTVPEYKDEVFTCFIYGISFSILHELGHCTEDKDNVATNEDNENHAEEINADYFAAKSFLDLPLKEMENAPLPTSPILEKAYRYISILSLGEYICYASAKNSTDNSTHPDTEKRFNILKDICVQDINNSNNPQDILELTKFIDSASRIHQLLTHYSFSYGSSSPGIFHE